MATHVDSKGMVLPDLLMKGLLKYPAGESMIHGKREGVWYSLTRDEFLDQVVKLALGLYELGVRKGDRVSIHAENSMEWLICDLATLFTGVVNVPIYPTQAADQIEYILRDSEAKVHLVANDRLFAETKPVIKSIESVQAVVSFYGSSYGQLEHFDEILELGRKRRKEEPDLFDELKAQVEPDDLATLIYTSGTTGEPKGVMLTQHNVATNMEASLTRLPFTFDEIFGQPVLSYLPLSHIFERMVSYMYISMQARIHYIQDIDEIKEDFLHVKPFFFATVPRLLEKIQTGVKVKGQELSGVKKQLYYWALRLTEVYDPERPPTGFAATKHRLADKLIYSKIRPLFGGNLMGVVTGGAALTPEIFRFMNAIGIYCAQGYGLTETSPVITVQDPKHMRVGSSGVPIDDVEVKIAEDGEICARGPNIMKGYYKKPEITKEVLTDDGWFLTGDIGRIDEQGYLFITDRKKSLFKLSTGKYVAPQHVENQIVSSGFIDQIVVTGSSRKFCSAVIVPAYENVKKRLSRDGIVPDEPLSKDPRVIELIKEEVEKGNKGLSHWEQVKKFVLLDAPLTIDTGELTPTLKVRRSVVHKKFEEQLNALYEE